MASIPGKGLGVIALRDIPSMTRIMVDRGYAYEQAKLDPRFTDLYPQDEIGMNKFKLNATAGHGDQELLLYNILSNLMAL